jgi:hypothetical protein
MTRKWIAPLLPGVALAARSRTRATVGGLLVAACAVMALSGAASAHSPTGHVYAALGETSVTAPIPDCAGGGGVHD